MRVLIFANGPLDNPPDLQNLIETADLVIAADGGADHCADIGIQPHILLGDFDSVSPRILKKYEEAGVEILRHPTRKDATDLELALDLAQSQGANHVWLLGVLGGRWDMSLANIMLAAGERFQDIFITIPGQNCTMHILHPEREHIIAGNPGDTLSLLPLKGDVHGVTLTDFEYPLHEHSILFGSSLGVSNILRSERALVRHKAGVLLCIRQFQV